MSKSESVLNFDERIVNLSDTTLMPTKLELLPKGLNISYTL